MLEASAAAREWAIRKLVPVATIAQVDVRIESIIHLGREPLSGNQDALSRLLLWIRFAGIPPATGISYRNIRFRQ